MAPPLAGILSSGTIGRPPHTHSICCFENGVIHSNASHGGNDLGFLRRSHHNPGGPSWIPSTLTFVLSAASPLIELSLKSVARRSVKLSTSSTCVSTRSPRGSIYVHSVTILDSLHGLSRELVTLRRVASYWPSIPRQISTTSQICVAARSLREAMKRSYTFTPRVHAAISTARREKTAKMSRCRASI
jgi:hypothetical protein